VEEFSRIRHWLRQRFPRQPHIYFGLSGATLLNETLKTQQRSSVVLSAFLCPGISSAIARAGKRVIHVDADPCTMHPRMDQLELCLARENPSHTAVLIDHSFGYPFPGLDRLRRRFPDVLFIEDCARALGAEIHGQFPGANSDWVLISMYKTVAGSRDGAILLTNTPLALRDNGHAVPTLRERACTLAPLRFAYDLVKRARPDFDVRSAGRHAPAWDPVHGFPNGLCVERFTAELDAFESRLAQRRAIARELTASISRIEGLAAIEVAAGCESAGHFVSFRVLGCEVRDPLLKRLHASGLFLSRTWDLLPSHYPCFAETFPMGHSGSDYLGEHIAHIPVHLFLSGRRRRRLVDSLAQLSFEYAPSAA